MKLAQKTALATTIFLSHLAPAHAAYAILGMSQTFLLADLTTGVQTSYRWTSTSSTSVSAAALPFSGELNTASLGMMEGWFNAEAGHQYRLTQAFSYALYTLSEGDAAAWITVSIGGVIDGSGVGNRFQPDFYGPGKKYDVADQFGFYFTALTTGPKMIQAGGSATARALAPLVPDVPDVPVSQVPEASSFGLAVSGMLTLLGMAWVRRRLGRSQAGL